MLHAKFFCRAAHCLAFMSPRVCDGGARSPNLTLLYTASECNSSIQSEDAVNGRVFDLLAVAASQSTYSMPL